MGLESMIHRQLIESRARTLKSMWLETYYKDVKSYTKFICIFNFLDFNLETQDRFNSVYPKYNPIFHVNEPEEKCLKNNNKKVKKIR